VEDDDLIRGAARDMLEDLGYAVDEAADADAALGRLERGGVDVLLTDVQLPGLSGVELARAAARRWPSLALIFASGDGVAAAETGLKGAIPLAKPYTAPDLERAVQRALA